MTSLNKRLENIRTSLWFLPTLIVAAGVVLAVALIRIDERMDPGFFESWPRVLGVSAEGAQSTLSAIATSVMTVTGVTFSVTIVALTLVASQYTSRVLRTFLRDRGNQAVLGVLLGVFAYCLVVLQAIRSGPKEHFVPALAAMVAVLLAFVAVGFLIYFIHHIATSIQVAHILGDIGKEAAEAIDQLFPERLAGRDDNDGAQQRAELVESETWQALPARNTGYIQEVDAGALLKFACEHSGIVRVEHAIGGFVVEGAPLVWLARTGPICDKTVKRVNRMFTIGRYRTVEQDASFAIRQIVDMAVRALSPGVNDTTTASMGVSYLTAILVRLSGRRIASPYRMDGVELRVLTGSPSFEGLLSLAFGQIRQNANGNTVILSQLLQSLETIAAVTQSPCRRRALLEHVEAVLEVAQRTVAAPRERSELETLARRVAGLLSTRNIS